MSGRRAVPIGFFLLILTPAVRGQTLAPSSNPPGAPEMRRLTGADEERAKRLDEQIDLAMKDDRWDEAIARAEELRALRARVQGSGHFEAVDARWRVEAVRRVAALPAGERAAFRSATSSEEQAESLHGQGKNAEARPLFERALEVRRRLLTDDHPLTATSYNDLACNLQARGKYAEARPLFERALAIRRKLLTDDHPRTA